MIVRSLFATVLFFVTGCSTITAPQEIDERASFELSLAPWYAVAIDTGSTGGAHATWSVAPSDATASDGAWSVRLQAMNATDAVKVFLERRYAVARSPGGNYDVTIAFDFGTSDHGAVNLWRIVAGAFGERPRSAAALEPAFREETGGAATPGTVRWVPKQYSTRVVSARGEIYVTIGVWGTFEADRTYFIDNVRVTIRPAPAIL